MVTDSLTVHRFLSDIDKIDDLSCSVHTASSAEAKGFRENIDINPLADIEPLLIELGADWDLAVVEFKALCEKVLTENQRQCLYRHWNLNIEGRCREKRSLESISQERSASRQATSWAIDKSMSKLRRALKKVYLK